MSQSKVRYLLAGAVIILISVAAVLLVKKNQPVVTPEAAAPQTPADTKIKGPANAPVKLIEYSDFQCPACKNAEEAINAILLDPDYAGKIQFIYRHFPLSGHQWSGPAHQSAECANQAGKFWEYHDILYAEQEKWSAMPNPVEAFIKYAKDLGISEESFALCLADPKIQKTIMDEKELGALMQISSTPTFFVNDERVVGQFELNSRGIAAIRKILGLPPKVIDAAPAPTLPQLPMEPKPAETKAPVEVSETANLVEKAEAVVAAATDMAQEAESADEKIFSEIKETTEKIQEAQDEVTASQSKSNTSSTVP